MKNDNQNLNYELISVAIATYNGEKFLRDQIDSVLAQSYPNIELVIGDDASSDSTLRIIEDYVQKDARIRVQKNNENIGFLRNFERIIYSCKGKYIAFCDQDDIWERNHLSLLYDEIKCRQVSLVGANADVVNEQMEPQGYTVLDTTGVVSIPQTTSDYRFMLFHINIFQGAAMMIDRDLISYSLPIPEEIRFHDWWFALCAVENGGVSYLPQSVLKYRQHGKNITENEKSNVFQKFRRFFDLHKHRSDVDNISFLAQMLKVFENKSNDKESVQDAVEYLNHIDKLKSFPYFYRNYFRIYRNNNRILKGLRIIKRCLTI